eukprot:5117498-Amphidinium_carterae.1
MKCCNHVCLERSKEAFVGAHSFERLTAWAIVLTDMIFKFWHISNSGNRIKRTLARCEKFLEA